MIKKLLFSTLLFFVYYISIAQSNRVLIKGVIKNPSLAPIVNAHIVNLTTKVGAISNKNGAFNIPVKEGDWLQVSNIQFITKKVKIKKGSLKERVLLIYLIPVENELEEAVIKKKMKGVLSLDRIDQEKDTVPKVDKKYSNFSKMDLSIKKVKNLQDKTNAQYHTDPTMKNVAVSIVSVGIPDNSSKKKRAQKKELNFKENFPNKLKQKFGEHFFFVKLKIPKGKYFHFLQHCEPLNIERLFKEENYIDLLKILLKESKSYLLLIENNK